ncbi:uncharacterized protein si:ch211-119e14.1 [Anguilla anguilla]|uniref:uncharacterized protein si:ch211-119e14.1 n=1 Tax=Anguilla anguilla TaxID=7936 RepID=UPI0015ACB02A|nr:uncharacterized protein si:ch211-119e14.1 [Anguilla anguilla]
MKSSTAQLLQVSRMVVLGLVTLQIVTGNYIMASAAEMEATDTGTEVAALLPAAREGMYSASRKSGHETGSEENTLVRRRRNASLKTEHKPEEYRNPNTPIVVFLVFLLIFLILALVYFYKRLNRETDGQYTLTKLVNEAREHAQNAARPIESRLRGLLRRRTDEDEDEERGREEDDEKESRERVSLKDAENLSEDEQREEADSSDDYSSMEGFQPQEGEPLQRGSEKGKKGKRASQEKKEEKKTEVAEVTDEKKEEKQAEGEGGQAGAGLLADLKEISGSAIWAAEGKNEGDKDSGDVTEL